MEIKQGSLLMKRNMIVLGIVLILIAIAIYQNWAKQGYAIPEERSPSVGFIPPAITLEGLDGETYAVDGSREKALLVNFWASWCEPCHEEAPDLVKLYGQYKQSLDIYAVNVTHSDSVEGARDFVEQYDLPFPVLMDRKRKDNHPQASDLYRLPAFPTTYFIDRNGVIRDIVLGIRPYAEMEAKIQKLIRQ